MRQALIRVMVAAVLLAASAPAAVAQVQARVIANGATIWREGEISVAATTVTSGALLEVTGRVGRFYEVVIPNPTGAREPGLIAMTQVELLGDSAVVPERRLPAQRAQPPKPKRFGQQRFLEGWGFGQVGVMGFTARKSFDAVFGTSAGAIVGAGGQLRVRGGLYVEASVSRFEKTGQRVSVTDGRVSKLGIPDTIRLVPVTAIVGYRIDRSNEITPYFGAGAGQYRFRETSTFADPSENTNARYTSYHVVGGVEVRRHWAATAVEVQYVNVPNSLGKSGAAAAFGEKNLGGVEARLKILLGG
jgi:hypothetical protein